jgi:hypothetical protein
LRRYQDDLDIVQVVSQYVKLKKSGRGFIGLCPLHHESSPSLRIYPDTNSFYCWGCDVGGSPRTFLKRLGVEVFSYKLQALGMDRPEMVPEPPTPAEISVRIINPEIVVYWHRKLKDRKSYFLERGFDEAMIKSERWGWSSQYGRYTIPVWEGLPSGSDIVGMRLRASRPEQKQKYIGIAGYNSPALYNRYVLEGSSRVAIVFGEFDAKAATLLGLPSVSPTAGAGGFDREWVKLFSHCSEVIIVPDNTEQELSAANLVYSYFDERASVKALPREVKDFNEYLLKYKRLDEFWEYNQWVEQQRLQLALNRRSALSSKMLPLSVG